jgi:hypothetical protein
MAILVKVIICQFQFVERKRLFHPMGTGGEFISSETLHV